MDNNLMYNVDLVFCIDATGSMGKLIETVKENALSFYDRFVEKMKTKKKHINELRVRVIAFRDYIADGEDAMLTTNFYNLPEEAALWKRGIESITAQGGGDIPEDGLEALAYAIRSKWNRGGDRRRQVIAVWTDAPAHELGFGKESPYYPSRIMAKNLRELTEWWGDKQCESDYIEFKAKRLVLFAPDEDEDGNPSFWEKIEQSWDNTIMHPARAGEGLQEMDFDYIIDMLAESV